MIIFQTESYQANLTHLKPSLNEENNVFVNDSLKNYSVPFAIELGSQIAKDLGLPDLESIYNYKTIIKGVLIIDGDFFNAYIKLGQLKGNALQANLYYGDEIIEVYQKNLRDLPWPTIITTTLNEYAESILDLSYPEVTHNFPMVYRPSIKQKEDYSDFKLFVNNWQSQNFLNNSLLVGPPQEIRNEYVMAPHPYLLEIIRFIYLQEGKTVKGELFEDPLFKKVVYIPDNFFEKFLGNQYDAFQFNMPTSSEVVDDKEFSIYERVYTPNLTGTYEIDFEINLNATIASFFNLQVIRRNASTQESTIIYERLSEGRSVSLSDKVEINVASDALFDQIKIVLKLKRQTESIQDYNTFEYNFREGRLNVFPTQYTLRDFVPNKTAGEFINDIKNWLNLDITINDHDVILNFNENNFISKDIISAEHLRDPKKIKDTNKSKFYKLTYKNDEEVKVDYLGQSQTSPSEFQELVPIEMGLEPIAVRENFGHLTGSFNENADGMQFGIYDGIQFRNYLLSDLDDKDLSLQQNYELRWKNWLKFRTNSFSFKDKFKAYISEVLDIKKIWFKYNQLHVIKKITKKRLSDKLWSVEVESETL